MVLNLLWCSMPHDEANTLELVEPEIPNPHPSSSDDCGCPVDGCSLGSLVTSLSPRERLVSPEGQASNHNIDRARSQKPYYDGFGN